MKFPQNILIIVTGQQETHYALNRALQFAQFYDVKLTLFSCVYDPGTELSPLLPSEQKNKLKQSKLQQRLDYLNQLKSEVEAENISVTTQVVWERKMQRAVIQACEDLNPDLVVKRISHSASSINPFNMPVDWQLLRKCPAPLLLIREQNWNFTAPILAAVDAASEDKNVQTFNQHIIAYAKLLSRLTETTPHVATTHISPAMDNAINIPGFDLDDLREKVSNLNQQKLESLLVEQNIPKQNQHAIEGLAEERLPKLAEAIGSQIIVMGTIGRRGIKGALMGNTAERVLSHLPCEVLALKPTLTS